MTSAEAITTQLHMNKQIEYAGREYTKEHPVEVFIQLQSTRASI